MDEVTDDSTINYTNIGSDHRLIRYKLRINTKLECAKKLKTTPRSNVAALKLNNADFKLTLSNRFKDLQTTDINERNDQIISITIQSERKDQYKELPIEIKTLLEKRRT